jgi:hypothetical protein
MTATQTATPKTTTWQIDPAHNRVELAVKHLMIATVRGRLEPPLSGPRWRHFVSGEMLDNKWRFCEVRRTARRCLRSSMKASREKAHHKGFVGIRRWSDGATAGPRFHRSRCWQARCNAAARAPSPSATSAFSDGLPL